MRKNVTHFLHNVSERKERKMRRLIEKLGIEGYGIYFMLLETLTEEETLSYPLSDLDLLPTYVSSTIDKIKSVIFDFELFEVTDSNFSSPKLTASLQPYLKLVEQKSKAGRASGKKRRQKMLEENQENS
jgi:hypothetical protein